MNNVAATTYWYEKNIVQHTERDKALSILQKMCHSLVIKNGGPFRSIPVGDRTIAYIIIGNLRRNKGSDWSPLKWQGILSSILKEIADELVVEKKYKSPTEFYDALMKGIEMSEFSKNLSIFILKAKRECQPTFF